MYFAILFLKVMYFAILFLKVMYFAILFLKVYSIQWLIYQNIINILHI
jgi:hypothetical protein